MQSQAQQKLQKLQKSASDFANQPPPPPRIDAPTIWRRGNARLLDYGRDIQGPPKAYALLVPSLINRHYILDLSEKLSFARYLGTQGIYPLLLDWGDPGEVESGYDMADYVENVLLPALSFASTTTGHPIQLLGYCLGGVLALAATQLAPNHQVQSLALLATPWDFLSEDSQTIRLPQAQIELITRQIQAAPTVPPLLWQWLFMLRQPFAFEQKCRKYDELTGKAEKERFMLVERWLNDGVPMASPAALDCLIHWAQENQLHTGKWRVGNTIINPNSITQPCFIAIPNQDTIVPTGCATPLATQIPHATLCTPNSGHIGMIAGRKAKRELWEPYVAFIKHNSPLK